MDTPVLFLIFNRPDLVGVPFEAIRAARPKRLYVSADGPRAERIGEAELCYQAREIVKKVDWECEVYTLFRTHNLGCEKAVSSGISWFFQHEPEGIILEDDLVIHEDFFPYCQWLLEYYRDDPRIMHISGDNFQFLQKRGTGSYYFSTYPHCWGWATWARAWKLYDPEMHGLEQTLKNKLPALFSNPDVQAYWRDVFYFTLRRYNDSWAYRWTYNVFANQGLCILPSVNLVGNIGFGSGTHTIGASPVSNIPIYQLKDFVHPDSISRNVEADDFSARIHFLPHGLSLENLLQEAINLFEQHNYTSCIDVLKTIMRNYEQHYLVLQLLATTYMAQNNYEQAMDIVMQLKKIKPELAQTMLNNIRASIAGRQT